MFAKEAAWFREQIQRIAPSHVSPLLNLGSSTEEFRAKSQPYITRDLIAPIVDAGVRVVHCDIKDAVGVDIVGDITSPEFVSRLEKMGFRSIICSNMLEHVLDPKAFSIAINKIVPVGGFLFISCPYRYPYHPDPIDNMLRPTPSELAAYFQDTVVIDSAIISGGRYGAFNAGLIGNLLLALRLLAFFYRPSRWAWHFREMKVSCLVLRKIK